VKDVRTYGKLLRMIEGEGGWVIRYEQMGLLYESIEYVACKIWGNKTYGKVLRRREKRGGGG